MKRSKWIPAILTPMLVGLTGMTSSLLAETPKDLFEAPVALKTKDSVLNSNNEMLYASPAIFDVDQDGKDELVIGTIFGAVYACENEGVEDGEIVWSAPQTVDSTDGKPLGLNNW